LRYLRLVRKTRQTPKRKSSDAVLPRAYRLMAAPAGSTINLQTDQLDAPERSMHANWIDVQHRAGTVEIAFGQLPTSATVVSAALIISISARHIRALLEQGADFRASLEKFCSGANLEPTIFRSATLPQERVVMERAALLTATVAEDESDIRFYRISPSDITRINKGQQAELVYAVVEIVLATQDLAGLYRLLLGKVPALDEGGHR